MKIKYKNYDLNCRICDTVITQPAYSQRKHLTKTDLCRTCLLIFELDWRTLPRGYYLSKRSGEMGLSYVRLPPAETLIKLGKCHRINFFKRKKAKLIRIYIGKCQVQPMCLRNAVL